MEPSNDAGRMLVRLALVTESAVLPSWVLQSVRDIESSSVARFVLVIQLIRSDSTRRTTGRLVKHYRECLYGVHQTIDRLLFPRKPDALALQPLRSLLPLCPTVQWPLDVDDGQTVASALRIIEEQTLDILFDPFCLSLQTRLAGSAKYGTWIIQFGNGGGRTHAAPGFWEVIDGTPITETRLCVIEGNAKDPRVLYASAAPTDRRSVARSQNHFLWKTSSFLLRKVQEVWDTGYASLLSQGTIDRPSSDKMKTSLPSNVEMCRAGLRVVQRYLSDKLHDKRYQEQWSLAYCFGDWPFQTNYLSYLTPDLDRFWADPFPIKKDDRYYIFHEEAPLSTWKGIIALTVMDEQGRCEMMATVLEAEYHLSYPFVFEWDNQYFMVPETAQHRQVELYRCISFPMEWRFERVLIPNIRAVDPTLIFQRGRWWLFANCPVDGALNTDELHLFYSNTPAGPWTAHRRNPIKSDVRSSRPAGRLFERGGHLYRPAQDGSKRYGYAISINHVLRLTPDEYQETEVEKILPDWNRDILGVHTLNRTDKLTIIDCLMRRRKRAF